MNRPLYKSAAKNPESRDFNGHAGLWFDKFCNQWRTEKSWTLSSNGGNPKLNWIKKVTNKSDASVGNLDEIKECMLRQVRLIESSGGRFAVYTTESRFVTGLGRSHPVENGFAWHPTLGTPYLPGSSVKGMVRAWAETEGGLQSGASIGRLFGGKEDAGRIGFLDALPIACVKLEADVMTPHYAGWDVEKPPGDWMSPTPIPFLAVAAKTSLVFAAIPCRAATDDDLDAVMGWIDEALFWAGAGAKTAVGYGRFRRDEEKTRIWAERVTAERRLRDAIESPVGRWRLEIEGKTEEEVLELIRIHLERKGLLDPAERQAFAKAVHAVRLDWVERWQKGFKNQPSTNVGRKKLKLRANALDAAAAAP